MAVQRVSAEKESLHRNVCRLKWTWT